MKRIFLILMVAVFTFGAMAQDQRGPRNRHGNDRGPAHRKEKVMAMLDLTDAQREEITSMKIAHEKAIKSDQQTLKVRMVELDNLVANDDPNEKELARLTDEIGGLQTALLKARTNHRIDVRSVLNEEQKLKFDKMKVHRGRGGKRGR